MTDTTLQIAAVAGRMVLDSRGYPTVEVRLRLADGAETVASAPAGASTGAFEAIERRDGGAAFGGRGVRDAVSGIDGELASLLTSRPWTGIGDVDAAMATLDGTERLGRLGANAIVALSIAAARGFAHRSGREMWEWLAGQAGGIPSMPVPHFNVLNGGAHAANALPFQEFLIAPVDAADEVEAVSRGAEVYHALATRVAQRFGAVGLGDEGGFAPGIDRPEQALDLILEAIADAGEVAGIDRLALAIDPAANGFFLGDGRYRLADRTLDRDELVEYYRELADAYPLRSIEDGFAEDDHEGWEAMAHAMGERMQLVGDDLYVTDARRIAEGGRRGWSNAALIKPNQIGTVSGTLEAIAAARAAGMRCMVSHRSGETADDFIADLVVGTGVGQIKSGAPARGERVAKYNRLMQIASAHPELGYGLAGVGGRASGAAGGYASGAAGGRASGAAGTTEDGGER